MNKAMPFDTVTITVIQKHQFLLPTLSNVGQILTKESSV